MEVQVVDDRLSGMPAKQKRVPMSLFHLPDELLLQVIAQLGKKDLYALSVQCKRLQRLSLPPYLLCRGVAMPLIFPMDHLVLTRQQFFVPGILLAFFAKNVRRFSCDIGPVSSWDPTLDRLCRMIININGLEDLAFYFKNWRFTPLLNRNSEIEECIHLLDVVAECCSSLTLNHNGNNYHYWMPFHASLRSVKEESTKWKTRPLPNWGPFKAVRKRLPVELESSRPRSFHASLRQVKGESTKWKTRPLPNWGSFKAVKKRLPVEPESSRSRSSHLPESFPHRLSGLKTLIFESNMFVVPPFSGWASKILNTAPLTRLDLVDADLSYAPHISALVFGALTIPTLIHLRIITCKIEFDALAEFLSRHKTISTLDIISGDMHQLPITTLPSLVSLKSNPHTVSELLTPAGAFPELTQVRVVTYLSPNDPFMSDALENSLAGAAKRLSETNIRFCLDILPVPQISTTWSTQKPRTPILNHVREIAFGPDIVAPRPATFPTWLSTFPLLEHIEFLNPQIGLDHQTKMSLLRLISQACPRIRSVRIGGDTRDVSAWLSSEN